MYTTGKVSGKGQGGAQWAGKGKEWDKADVERFAHLLIIEDVLAEEVRMGYMKSQTAYLKVSLSPPPPFPAFRVSPIYTLLFHTVAASSPLRLLLNYFRNTSLRGGKDPNEIVTLFLLLSFYSLLFRFFSLSNVFFIYSWERLHTTY
jgi:hypothetical protein